jgi:ABC-type transport system substrate-binding protein
MNSDIEALKDLNFRKALSLAIDRLSVIDVAQNSAIPAKGFVPPGVPDADGSDFQGNAGNLIGISDDYAADCKAARQLLRDAGYNVTVAD